MATKVYMEALSPTMEEGQLVKWHKAEGDAVANGDLLAEIETDKATMELVARGEGVLRKVFLQEGAAAPVGSVIAIIGGADEDISGLVEGAAGEGAAAAAAGEAPSTGAPESTLEAAREKQASTATAAAPAEEEERAPAPAPAPVHGGTNGGAAPSGDGGRLKASPVARRLADEAGIDLRAVQGSGPGGRIIKRDVEEAAERGVPAAAPAWAGDTGPEYEDVKVSQMRKTIARRLVESLGPIPTFYLTVEADMGRALEVRKAMNAILEPRGEKVSLNDLLIRTVAVALRHHPEVNAAWQGDTIRRYNRSHVGVAVAVDEGLITPVVRDAHAKGVAAIGREVRELAGRAREKKLKPEEYTGATFSISNLGMFGIQEFTALINPPEAGILAVGQVEEIPVVVDGEVVARPRMKMTMSCDHRVVDGATGARFLQTLKAMIEEPGIVTL